MGFSSFLASVSVVSTHQKTSYAVPNRIIYAQTSYIIILLFFVWFSTLVLLWPHFWRIDIFILFDLSISYLDVDY